MINLLNDYGYNCYWHVYPKFNINNHKKQQANVWINPGERLGKDNIHHFFEGNLVAIHKHRAHTSAADIIQPNDNIVKYLERHGELK